MQVDMTTAITQVETASQRWEQIAPVLSPSENLQNLGVSVTDISRSFSEVVGMIHALKDIDLDGVMWSQYKGSIEANSVGLYNFFNAHGNNPAQIVANTNTICAWLWGLRSSLRLLLPVHPESGTLSEDFQRELTERIAAFESWFVRAEELKNTIQQTETSASEILQQIKTQNTSASDTSQTIQAILTSIQGFEREAGTAKVGAESAATDATSKATAVSKLAEDLADSVNRKDALFKEFEDRREQISGYLENANKVGLAKSFQDKRKELTTTWRLWAGAFALGILALSLIGWFGLLPLIRDSKTDMVAIASRFILSSPVIWFTWFAARQYGHVLRISEDYAFKEAAAMAFAGYRNEVAADPELLKLLQESAIKNFGANPSKLLLKKPDASSPLHEVFDKALDKVKPEALTELISNLTELIKKLKGS